MSKQQQVYLAGRFSRRLEFCNYVAPLLKRGLVVCSTWIWSLGDDEEMTFDQSQESALSDWHELREADICIAFTEPPRTVLGRGGRHAELGAALAWEKRVIVVGPAEHIFCDLPKVRKYMTWEELLSALDAGEVEL